MKLPSISFISQYLFLL